MSKWLVWGVMLYSFAASAQEGVADVTSEDIDASYSLHADDAPVGVITTYISKNRTEEAQPAMVNPSSASQYTSFGIGPSVKLGEHVTAYGVIGAAADNRSNFDTAMPVQALTLDNDARMYGVGMQIRPNQDWQIDMKYQNANLNSGADATRQINYFNVGIGYKFW